jgi:hypothetical protein
MRILSDRQPCRSRIHLCLPACLHKHAPRLCRKLPRKGRQDSRHQPRCRQQRRYIPRVLAGAHPQPARRSSSTTPSKFGESLHGAGWAQISFSERGHVRWGPCIDGEPPLASCTPPNLDGSAAANIKPRSAPLSATRPRLATNPGILAIALLYMLSLDAARSSTEHSS